MLTHDCADDETIDDVVLSCVTFTGKDEKTLENDYAYKCARKKIYCLYGQLVAALKRLRAAGKIEIVAEVNTRLCRKKR
jgi:hypothetical protein